MMKRKPFFLICAGTALCVCTVIWQVRAQAADNDPTATITFGNNQSVFANSDGRAFELVGLQSGEVIDVTVQFPADKVGHAIRIEPLDGGYVVSANDSVIIGDDGTVAFRFQVGHSPGRYQVSLHDGAQEIGLQFWVLDSANPQNNPLTLTPTNPGI
jgi:hypothetical protein